MLAAIGPIIQEWLNHLGDPGPVGWTITGGYLITVLLLLIASWRLARQATHPKLEASVWYFMAGLCVLLGLNKQLDLQHLARLLAKDLLRATDLYPNHRTIQIVAMALITCGCVACGVAIYRLVDLLSSPLRWVCLAFIPLVGYVAMRSLSFTHFDELLGAWILNMQLYWAMELAGIAIVMLATIAAILSNKKTRHP